MKSIKYWYNKYKEGKNISSLMREDKDLNYNSKDIIEMSYELQSGTYVEGMSNQYLKKYRYDYFKELSMTIKNLCTPTSILEAGIGEGTTMSNVMANFDKEINFFGFDISWSRIAFAKKWLESSSYLNNFLCTGELTDIPFLDNSIDVVYTSHSIEPNRGAEKEILEELFRITKKYLILLEPAYELTNDENRKRMDSHKYCKNLKKTAESLGFNVIKHELFKYSARDTNPTAITIIKKDEKNNSLVNLPFACPVYKTKLIQREGCFYSEEAMSIYPIINNIPCLRKENRILSIKYLELS